MRGRGAVCTRSIDTAIDYLDRGGAVATLFGTGNIYALFCNEQEQSLQALSRMKNRSKKPFFRITHPGNDILATLNRQADFLHPHLSDATLSQAVDIMRMAPRIGPIGVMFPANGQKLHWGLRGSLEDRTHGEIDTIGYMLTSYYDVDFGSLSRLYHEHSGNFLVGTSANPSGAEESRGSGHYSFGGLLHDFGQHDDLCIYVPRGVSTGSGLSTTLIFLDLSGNIDVMRVGSLPLEQLQAILEANGVDPDKIHTDRAKIIDTYDYDSHVTSHSSRRIAEEIAHELSHKQDVYVHDLMAHFALRAAL